MHIYLKGAHGRTYSSVAKFCAALAENLDFESCSASDPYDPFRLINLSQIVEEWCSDGRKVRASIKYGQRLEKCTIIHILRVGDETIINDWRGKRIKT